jgi:Fe-S oxidoreductase
MVKKAAAIANKNIELLSALVDEDMPIVGVEPSTILSFRDEYLDLAEPANKEKAAHLARHTFTIEEFISNEFSRGNIPAEMFTKE